MYKLGFCIYGPMCRFKHRPSPGVLRQNTVVVWSGLEAVDPWTHMLFHLSFHLSEPSSEHPSFHPSDTDPSAHPSIFYQSEHLLGLHSHASGILVHPKSVHGMSRLMKGLARSRQGEAYSEGQN